MWCKVLGFNHPAANNALQWNLESSGFQPPLSKSTELGRSGGGSHSSHRLNARDKTALFGRRSLRLALGGAAYLAH